MNDDVIEGEITALAVREEYAPPAPAGLWQTDDPVEVIGKATRVADALKAVVVSKGLISNIQGKQYPQVEAWLTLAAMLNLSPIMEWTKPIEGGWEARCIVRNRNDMVVGAAEAQCTRDERSWKSRDDYALRSMAQTRATSKALRSVLGFVMTLAGYQATPAEEMPRDDAPRSQAAHDRGRKAIMALCKDLGVTDDQRHAVSERMFGKQSTNDLNVEQLRELYSVIKEHYSHA